MELIERIKEGDNEVLMELYKQYRNPFINWAIQNFGSNAEEAKDVFQEVIVSFYSNIKSGRLTSLTSDVKTYLFAIGRFHLVNLYKKNSRQVTFSGLGLINVEEPYESSMENKQEEEHIKETVKNLLNNQCKDCKKVLELYYFKELNMEQIAEEMGYKNANVAKKKKYECLKKVMQSVKNKIGILVL